MITLGLLCWNAGQVGIESVEALDQEATRLRMHGYRTRVAVVDNGSTDGTRSQLMAMPGVDLHIICTENRGSSIARNLLIDASTDSDFLLLMDGDIEVVPSSIVEMVGYLQDHPDLSCLSPDPRQSVQHRDQVKLVPRPFGPDRLSTDALMYVCGYGLFRRSVFNTVRFDEAGPFGEAGWGHEDDDVWMQMVEQGYMAQYVSGMAYLHRSPRSSWVHLQNQGVDVLETFQRRKEYLLAKWRRPESCSGRLKMLEAQQVSHV